MPHKAASPQPTKSTQNSLQISEIKDGVVITRDGSMRAVILGSAINFDLMSTQEQNAVEYAYQGFLNSLHFPVQIIIKSQKLDLDNYIENLTRLRGEQDNELLGLLMDDYIANIKALVDEVNIMDKQFYVIVPYYPPIASSSRQNFMQSLGSIFKPVPTISVGEADFNNYKQELTQRVQLVASGLSQMGIRAIPLNTQELIDLYYMAYNPDVAPNQKLIDASQLQTAAVTRGGEPPQPMPHGATPSASAQPGTPPAVQAAPMPPTPAAPTPEPAMHAEPPQPPNPLSGGQQ